MIAGIMAGAVIPSLLCVGFKLSEMSENTENEVFRRSRVLLYGAEYARFDHLGKKNKGKIRTITHRQYAQKPRKWLKTVLFSTFGLLESAKKAVKNAFNTSLKRHFANS